MTTQIWEHASSLPAGCMEQPSCDGEGGLALRSADLDQEMSWTFLPR